MKISKQPAKKYLSKVNPSLAKYKPRNKSRANMADKLIVLGSDCRMLNIVDDYSIMTVIKQFFSFCYLHLVFDLKIGLYSYFFL